MDTLVIPAVDTRQGFVDFEDHNVRLVDGRPVDAECAGEIEIAVPVHRRDCEHGDVHREKLLVIPSLVSEDHRREESASLIAELSFIAGAVPGLVDEVLHAGITLGDLDRTWEEIAPHLDMPQFIAPCGKGRVEQNRKAVVGPIINPVTAAHEADRFLRCTQLLPVFTVDVHIPPSFHFLQYTIIGNKRKGPPRLGRP